MASPLEKFWANPQSRGAAIGGLVGAGGLGLAGYLMADKEKKKRSMLIAALLGGGLGAGAGWYANQPVNLPARPPEVAHPQNIAGLLGQLAPGAGVGGGLAGAVAQLASPMAMQQGGGWRYGTSVPTPPVIPGAESILSPNLLPESGGAPLQVPASARLRLQAPLGGAATGGILGEMAGARLRAIPGDNVLRRATQSLYAVPRLGRPATPAMPAITSLLGSRGRMISQFAGPGLGMLAGGYGGYRLDR